MATVNGPASDVTCDLAAKAATRHTRVDLGKAPPKLPLVRRDMCGTVQLYELVSGDLAQLISAPEPLAAIVLRELTELRAGR
jgi:hypothetical protein